MGLNMVMKNDSWAIQKRDNFNYLGFRIHENREIDEVVAHRIGAG